MNIDEEFENTESVCVFFDFKDASAYKKAYKTTQFINAVRVC